MDPNLFHVDWETMFEVMVLIVVLSFFVERALSLLLGSRVYIKHAQGKSLKEVIPLPSVHLFAGMVRFRFPLKMNKLPCLRIFTRLLSIPAAQAILMHWPSSFQTKIYPGTTIANIYTVSM